MHCVGNLNHKAVRSLFTSFDSNGDGAIDEGAPSLPLALCYFAAAVSRQHVCRQDVRL